MAVYKFWLHFGEMVRIDLGGWCRLFYNQIWVLHKNKTRHWNKIKATFLPLVLEFFSLLSVFRLVLTFLFRNCKLSVNNKFIFIILNVTLVWLIW